MKHLAVCIRSLLLGGLVLCLSFAGMQAQAEVPLPAHKPVRDGEKAGVEAVPENLPVPAMKPSAEEMQAPYKVATATKQDLVLSQQARAYSAKSFLSDRQARLAQEIFDLQSRGEILEANKRIAGLNSDVLMGHILAERYLNVEGYAPSFEELSDWMERYSDHPQATKIYQLALKQNPIRTRLRKPATGEMISGNLLAAGKGGMTYRSQKRRAGMEQARVQKLQRDVRRHIEKYEPTLALNIVSNDYALQFMDDAEIDQLHAMIAAGYLFAGKLEEALRMSDSALQRSGAAVPQAGWVRGLVQWQLRDYMSAAQAFEVAANSPYSTGWMVSAASYWASRAYARTGNRAQVIKWLDIAASYPRTFYGLIAIRAQGKNINLNWEMPSLNRDHVKFIESTKAGRRASALIKAGRPDLAEEELQYLLVGESFAKQQAMLAYAHENNLSALSMRLANSYIRPQGGRYDAALYPVPSWAPKTGYQIDRALIHAIARQESKFQSGVKNPSGATGLMQLMPRTASYVAGNDLGVTQADLAQPDINLELGQRYIQDLLNNANVGQDLLSLAIAYNAGPGNLRKWKAERAHIQDPLLFIETIPFHETRAFVERVLSNYWIYRIRLDQQTPSLDDVAKGRWARYISQDHGAARLAMH